MKRNEARHWLEQLKDANPRDIDWIMEALTLTSYSIDEKKFVASYHRQPNFFEILQAVAYGLTGLPCSLRIKKFPLKQCDDDEFYGLNDEEWEKYREDRIRKGYNIAPKYLFPEP